jgi:hypothetical protein
MIETRDGRMKSIVGFHNSGAGTAFTKAEGSVGPAGGAGGAAAGAGTGGQSRSANRQSIAVGSASEMLRKKYENVVLKQPEKGYSFKCEGDLLGKKHVQWSAKYNKSLEYIMFPSLSLTNSSGELQLNTVKDKLFHHPNTSLATYDKFSTDYGHGAAVDSDITWKVK